MPEVTPGALLDRALSIYADLSQKEEDATDPMIWYRISNVLYVQGEPTVENLALEHLERAVARLSDKKSEQWVPPDDFMRIIIPIRLSIEYYKIADKKLEEIVGLRRHLPAKFYSQLIQELDQDRLKYYKMALEVLHNIKELDPTQLVSTLQDENPQELLIERENMIVDCSTHYLRVGGEQRFLDGLGFTASAVDKKADYLWNMFLDKSPMATPSVLDTLRNYYEFKNNVGRAKEVADAILQRLEKNPELKENYGNATWFYSAMIRDAQSALNRA
jgi:tetratricopeptide (TPR) repeat protein